MLKKIYKKLKSKSAKKNTVYFITFHKTASSYFSDYILKQIIGLKHNDIASQIFQNKILESIDLKADNTIYGPIRLSLDEGPIYKHFVLPLLQQNILKKSKIICFIRDPRDIIVSFFYSQAYSHIISDNKEIRELQLKNREYALQLGIDKYAIEKTDFFIEKFNILIDILEKNNNAILLKYEDMIYDFEKFYQQINDFVALPAESKEIIYQDTRPKNEGIYKHRRDGKKGGYKSELKEETVKIIDDKLKKTLEFFNYQ